MAVQKSRKSRARRGMRRAHHSLEQSAVSVDPTTGEIHRRHHITNDGYYRGKQVISVEKTEDDSEE